MALAAEIKVRTEPWYQRLTQPVLWTSGDWSIDSPEGTGVHGANQRETTTAWLEHLASDLAPIEPEVRFSHAERWLTNTGAKVTKQLERYRQSRADGTDFSRAYQRILDNQNPARFDYYEYMGLSRQL